MTAAVLQRPTLHLAHKPSNFHNIMKPQPESKPSLANIAPRDGKPPDSADSNDSTARSIDIPRTRLPPRSRFGCWTCRTRKVKCDEARPACTPCSRLGHNCDYNPRLSFKDDTPRVVKKISGRGGGEGPVWKRRCLKSILKSMSAYTYIATDSFVSYKRYDSVSSNHP